MKTLFINACVRENSRTLKLAREILKDAKGEIAELELCSEGLMPLDRESLAKREALRGAGDFSDPIFNYAKQFAEADEIFIAAPFWDLSFPSIVKVYLEYICVVGITFGYERGIPSGLCSAKRLVYITTSGGEIFADFGYSYVKELATSFFGIKDTVSYRAMNLDVDGISAERILTDAKITSVK